MVEEKGLLIILNPITHSAVVRRLTPPPPNTLTHVPPPPPQSPSLSNLSKPHISIGTFLRIRSALRTWELAVFCVELNLYKKSKL